MQRVLCGTVFRFASFDSSILGNKQCLSAVVDRPDHGFVWAVSVEVETYTTAAAVRF